MRHFKRFSTINIFVFVLFFTLIACSRQENNVYKPEMIPVGTTCASCGMIVLKYSGPHVQVIWKNGKRTFYCDLREIMSEILNKVYFERMGAIYVQNFGGKKWGSYNGNWIKAQTAVYVIFSRKSGSMGQSFVPFKNKDEAREFQKTFGGKIFKFSQITQAVVAQANKLSVHVD